MNNLLQNYAGLRSDLTMQEQLDQHLVIEKSWVIAFDEIKVLRDIAGGATGRVMLARWRGVIVAVKRFFIAPSADPSAFVKESVIHRELRHPNIVQMYGVCIRPYCVVMEFMARGCLFDVLNDISLELPSKLRLRFALDIASGLTYIHSRAILHRDLKTLNIFLSDDWRCKVGDFGQARSENVRLLSFGFNLLRRRFQPSAGRCCGRRRRCCWARATFRCLPDASRQCEASADVFSFGVMLWELYTRHPPYEGDQSVPTGLVAFAQFLESGGRPRIPDDMEDWHKDLIERCWATDPQARPTMVRILEELTDRGEVHHRMSTSGQEMLRMVEELEAAMEEGAPLRPSLRRKSKGIQSLKRWVRIFMSSILKKVRPGGGGS